MTDLAGRRISLIGGAGFIGHHLALALQERGAVVQVVDGLAVNNLLAVTAAAEMPNRDLYLEMIRQRIEMLHAAKIPLHVQDARDYLKLSDILMAFKPQVIVHLAAVAHADRSNKDPFSTFDHNLRTLENALDHSRGTVEHFIYFSSSMVYGNFPGGFVTEETPCDPVGIYGALKFAGEKIVIAYGQVFDLPWTIVRPSALYGERCISRRVGQVFIENAMKGLEIGIAGDGSDRLDFTYVGDLVQGILRVIENEKARNQIFNLTYGESRSIAQLVEILKSQFPDVKFRQEPRDRLMPARGTLSIEKARRLLGYEPEFPIEKGFPAYIRWYRSFWKERGSS